MSPAASKTSAWETADPPVTTLARRVLLSDSPYLGDAGFMPWHEASVTNATTANFEACRVNQGVLENRPSTATILTATAFFMLSLLCWIDVSDCAGARRSRAESRVTRDRWPPTQTRGHHFADACTRDKRGLRAVSRRVECADHFNSLESDHSAQRSSRRRSRAPDHDLEIVGVDAEAVVPGAIESLEKANQ